MSERTQFIDRLIIDDPRKETALSGIVLLLGASVLGLILASLLNLGLGVAWNPFEMFVEPSAWLPEIISSLLLIGFSAASILASIFVRRAVPFHLVRTWGVLALGVLLLVAAIRLLAAVGGSTVALILAVSMVFDIVLQAPRARDTNGKLHRAHNRGEFENFLDTKNWTWNGALYPDVKLALQEEDEASGAPLLQHLHWFAPAIGIFFARYFGAPLSALLVGSIFTIGAVVLFRRTLEEIGTLLFLRAVEWNSEQELLLVWKK